MCQAVHSSGVSSPNQLSGGMVVVVGLGLARQMEAERVPVVCVGWVGGDGAQDPAHGLRVARMFCRHDAHHGH